MDQDHTLALGSCCLVDSLWPIKLLQAPLGGATRGPAHQTRPDALVIAPALHNPEVRATMMEGVAGQTVTKSAMTGGAGMTTGTAGGNGSARSGSGGTNEAIARTMQGRPRV